MAHILHGASRATAAARGFSLFFIAAHFKNDERANDDQNKGNDDGCEILRKPKHGNTSFFIKIRLKLFGQLRCFFIRSENEEKSKCNKNQGHDETNKIKIACES